MAKTRKKMRKLKNRMIALEAFAANHLEIDHGYVEAADGTLVGNAEMILRADQVLEAVADNG